MGDFQISKYLVTNAQYAAFVKAGGYGEKRYWKAAGWERKVREKWAGPGQSRAPFDLPNHPVVLVSYYEAAAFCLWLSEQLGCKISLPTAAQWTQAVQGDDGRKYPWGNDADSNKANYDETGIGATSAVGCFPGGVSPFGALDMGGNVFEWTESEDRAALRGGAFDYYEWNVCCAFRRGGAPGSRGNFIGFRVVVGVPH